MAIYANLIGYWRQLDLSKERAIFRFDPVPGVKKKSWKFRCYYKTANCLQERKLYGDPDHRKYGRGKRYPDNLPDAWDDYSKSRTHDLKSWKRVKKEKQWINRGVNMITLGPTDNRAASKGFASDKKKVNYDMSETKVNSEDYTKASNAASQTEDDDLRPEPVEEGYEVSDNQKNPERDSGAPGMRVNQDPFADVGQPPLEDILPPEDDTPVVEDDGSKHGSKNKYRIGGDEGKRGVD